MLLTLVQSAIPGGVTFVQLLPSSRVTCTRPLSVPTQTRPSAAGDGAIAKITPKPHALARATGTSPSQPLAPGTPPVRSGLITSQDPPALVERKSTCAPW